MNLNLKATGFEWTPALKSFVEKKLGTLQKFVKRFDAEGDIELRVEIAKTTEHHKKGVIFRAEANLRLPKELVRAEECAEDVRVAIDRLHHVLEVEIAKYKTKFVDNPRRVSKQG
ncbi:MAG: ribosome-associated translation inhibitor RaiA [Candidatus Liptonbacteria bacterium]|nr:ribosome-associated translation inhibitor RaiA [Candidatus Liptonbacteria bacterium]